MLRIITIKDMVLFMYKKIIQNITILLPIITLIYAISLLFPYYIHDNEFFSINYFNHYKATMMLVPTFSVICSLLLSKKKLPYSIYIIYIIYILYGNFFLLNNKEQITLNVGTNIIVAL